MPVCKLLLGTSLKNESLHGLKSTGIDKGGPGFRICFLHIHSAQTFSPSHDNEGTEWSFL